MKIKIFFVHLHSQCMVALREINFIHRIYCSKKYTHRERSEKKDECARSSQSTLLLSTEKGNMKHRYLFVFPSFWPRSFGESYERISGSIKKHFIQIYWSQLENGINMRVNEFNSDKLA